MLDVFGQNVQRERTRAGMTQEALATALEVSREYVSDIERGLVNVSMTRVVELVALLDTTVERLFENVADAAE
ncbi:MAG: Helix-turn-helix domain [Thermoleophilia bacterium]|nr:Helix-turn-helix domain [Thermoleophilia bacterium]